MNVGVPQEQIVNFDEISAKSPSIKRGWPFGAWVTFFSTTSNLLQALTMSGTTAQRPTTLLWIGRPYFDTTLGINVRVLSVGPPVWVRYDGVIV